MQPRKKIVHYNIPNHAHSLTFSCHNHRPYLLKDRTRLWLIEAINQARTRWNFRIWAYAIMHEHVHLICWPENEKDDISKFIKSVKQAVSRKARFYLEENNPAAMSKMMVKSGRRITFRFWQAGPGYDRNLIVDDTLMKNIEYLHNNPVRRELVKSPTDWEWSSARWYAGYRDVPLTIDPLIF